MKMKKKLLALTLCVATACSMSACGKDSKDNTKDSEGSIKLGKYTGYEVTEADTVIDEESVQKYIDAVLSVYATTDKVQEGVTAEGDKVNITYHATVNGEEVELAQQETAEDGTTSGITQFVTLSEDGFIVDGFTAGLTGKNIGETVEMDLQYPDDYSDETLAGQPVHYSVVLNYISKVTTPEYNDTFVSEKFGFAGYTTAEAYTEAVKQELKYIKINEAIWEDVLEAQTVESYPTQELSSYLEKMKTEIQNYITSLGSTMDMLYQAAGQTEDEYNAELEESCKSIVKEKMFVRAVAEKEGIKYDENAAAQYAAISGFASVDELKKQFEDYGEELEYAVISYQVENFVSDHVTVTNSEAETATEAETAAE